MGLRTYAKKRDFTRTAEPPPVEVKSPSPRTGKARALRYVIQKHDASRLHYDFRLELDGVLKSWAVPKGPSLNPADKRLAVQVEDHPVAYGDFEGTIPEGQYGGGTVMLWDRGEWTPEDDDPAASLRRGKLSFTLAGEKLTGGWTLARMHPRPGEEGKSNWLLMKQSDKVARAAGPSITEAKPLSVKTGRDLDAIAADDRSEVWDSSGDAKHARAKTNKTTKSAKGAKASRSASTAARRSEKADARTARSRAASPRARPRPPHGVARVRAALDPAALPGAREAPMPRDASPELCTLADHVPTGENWIHEIKFDGYRFLAHKSGADVRLITRAGKDWTARFRPLAGAIATLPAETAIIDGEATIVNAAGKTTFQGLQQAIKTARFERLAFFVFDLLYCDGHDITRAPLVARKELLRRIVGGPARGPDAVVRYSDHVVGDGSSVQVHACRLGLEGVISKRADAPYVQARSPDWLKIKCTQRQEFIIVGHTDPSGARSHFGSLLLAAHDGQGRLVYTGRVGTGFDEDSLRDIGQRLKRLARDDSPLDVPAPRSESRGAHWAEPKLVGEVAFTEWTEDGRLRHPSFQGLREDKEAAAVKIEKPKPVAEPAANGASRVSARSAAARAPRQQTAKSTSRASARPPAPRKPRSASAKTTKSSKAPAPKPARAVQRDATEEPSVAGVRITSPDRVVFPEQGLTKLELARYHEEVADLLLPFVVDRPLSTVRCPTGRGGQCFFQKHLGDTFSEPVHPMRVREKDGYDNYISIDSLEGLITLVQFGVLEIHPWGSRQQTLEQPDLLTFDLDPGEGVDFDGVKIGALRVRDVLLELGLEPFLKTSGGKGLHVIAPLKPKADWDEAKAFAQAVAQHIAREDPDRYVDNMSKQKRRGKIFIDYLRNGRGATSVAPYSVRARAGAPVSMPIRWQDLAMLRGANQYTVENTPGHLKTRRTDPWARFDAARLPLTAKLLDQLREGSPT